MLNEPAYEMPLPHNPVLNALWVSILRYLSKCSSRHSPTKNGKAVRHALVQLTVLKGTMPSSSRNCVCLWSASASQNKGTTILCNCLHRYGIKWVWILNGFPSYKPRHHSLNVKVECFPLQKSSFCVTAADQLFSNPCIALCFCIPGWLLSK